jgi:hypothetical protein
MKKINFEFLLLVLVIVLISFLSCGGGDGETEPTAQDEAFEILAGRWSLPSSGGIVVDGTDRSLNYPGFSLSFTNGGYTTNSGGDLFSATGTWEWADGTTTNVINLDDGKTINIQSLTTSQFVFSFNQSEGGTAAGVAGNYTITVNK